MTSASIPQSKLTFVKFTIPLRTAKGRLVKMADFSCSCGVIVNKRFDNVKYGSTTSCGKCAGRELKKLPKEINGIKVSKCLGMDRVSYTKPKRKAEFICHCGNKFISIINNVINGHTKSCGCLTASGISSQTHGLSRHPLYRKWSGMITRTTNENENCYKSYGGRGIRVCDEWRNDFKSFYDWSMTNGYRKGLTIDRIDNDGNYTPENCQYITMLQNSTKDRLLFNPSDSDMQEIISLYENQGLTITAIAAIYATHKERISKLLKSHNVQITHRRMNRCLKELQQKLMSTKKAARQRVSMSRSV